MSYDPGSVGALISLQWQAGAHSYLSGAVSLASGSLASRYDGNDNLECEKEKDNSTKLMRKKDQLSECSVQRIMSAALKLRKIFMSLAVNFLPLLVPLLLAAGIAFRSRMLIAVSFGAIPLALVIAIMGPQIAFGSPEIILFLAASSLCSAGLAWQVQTRITQRMIRVRKAQKGPRS